MEYMERIELAAEKIKKECGTAEVAVVLGSGLGGLADSLRGGVNLPYREIPGFPVPTAPGHTGTLTAGELGGKRLMALNGRFHLYEGHSLRDLTMPVRVLKLLGVETLILTNAAGGVNLTFQAGDLMAITDFINLTGQNPLIGPNLDAFGVRFPDMTHAYDPHLIELAAKTALSAGFELKRGVYCWMNGPCYETPAEIRMVRVLGGDAVGMSTVPETIVANHSGMKVLGVSCITNMAAGVMDQPLSHKEVMEAGERVKDRFVALISGVIEKM